MKFSKKTLSISLAVAALVTITALASGDDPVISLSYLNEVFLPKVETKIQENASFQVVNVQKGKTFEAKEGCEFILRSGQATVIASKNGGISDTTDGADLTQEASVPKNHLLVVPRSDGRGFWAATDVIVMVKGGYLMK